MMRHILSTIPTILLCSVVIPIPLLAQNVGLHMSTARTSVSESIAVDPATGMGGGVSLDIPLSDNAGFRTGVFYARKGVSFGEEMIRRDLHQGPMPAGGGMRLDYVELPLLLRLGVPLGNTVGAYVLLGATVGVKAGCSVNIEVGGSSNSADCGATDDFRPLDAGATGGAGVAIRLSEGLSVTLDALYNAGLVDFSDGPTGDRHRALTVLAGMRFPM